MARTIFFGVLILIVAELTGFWPDYEGPFAGVAILAITYHSWRYFKEKRQEKRVL